MLDDLGYCFTKNTDKQHSCGRDAAHSTMLERRNTTNLNLWGTSKNTKAYKEAGERGKTNVFTALEKETERLTDAFLKNPTTINMLNDNADEINRTSRNRRFNNLGLRLIY